MKRAQRVYGILVAIAIVIVFARSTAIAGRYRRTEQAESSSEPNQREIRKLELGKSIEREMKGGESHAYEITLEASQYFDLVVEQKGIDVVVQVIAPDGSQVKEVDSPNGTQGPEPVTLITESSGVFRLVVRSLEKDAPAGRYEIRVQELRAVTDVDRSLLEADRLSEEVERLRLAAKPDVAMPLAERALSIREKARGLEHDQVASSLNDLANLHFMKGDYAKAEPLYQRALAIREKALGPDHLDVATSLANLGGLYKNKGDYPKAEALHQRALAIREKALGPDHLDVAFSLNNLAAVYYDMSDYAKAEPSYRRAAAIFEKVLGPYHPDLAVSLDNLAVLYLRKGDYAKAEPLLLRALSIRERALAPDHPSIADSLSNLSGLYDEKGDFSKAEALGQRALAIREKVLGPEHPEVAMSLNGLAAIYYNKGDFVKAEPLYNRALAIFEKALGPEHPSLARSLSNLALVYNEKGEYSKAEPLYKRSIAIREKALGPDHPDLAQSLNNLALLYYNQGDYEKAEPLYQRSLAIREKALGSDQPAVAAALLNLASLYHATRDYAKAESLYQRALAIREKALGPAHPDVAKSLSHLARLYLARGDLERAITYRSRGNQARERDFATNLTSGSERQKLLYVNQAEDEFFATVSLHTQDAPDDATALRLALTVILTRKGRALDAMTDSIAVLRRRATPQEQTLLDQLADARAQLSSATLRGPGRDGAARHRENLKALEEKVDWLENETSVRSAEFRAQSQPVTIEAVQKAIPFRAALAEFASYRPFNAKGGPKEKRFGQPRYVAYVLGSKGEPRWVELGDAKSIDQKIEVLRKALRDRRRKDVEGLARAVDAAVMQPVRKLLGTTRHVFISPDGALNLIPFAALLDERGQYLVRRYLFTQLTSGRDLLRLEEKIKSKTGPIVMADADFDKGSSSNRVSNSQSATNNANSVTVGNGSTNASDQQVGPKLGEVEFEPLKRLVASAQEAREVKKALNQATVFLRGEATESALKQVSSPSILHIATHGYFLEEEVKPGSKTSESTRIAVRRKRDDSTASVKLENPALRSGLFFAGANKGKSGDDDGVLTALEAAGLDLWGTKLVVLSACDTGVGEVLNGQGVQGLRRALVLAGSESQMMSLWPVSDKGTRELMIEYYRRLKAGEGRSEALRRVQLKMLANSKRKHPFYWASFIQSGEWANLDGKRVD